MNINSILCTVSTTVFSTIFSINIAQAEVYQLIDLGTLGGTSSYGVDINDSGEVTGESKTADGEGHAFLYDGNTMQDLGILDSPYPGSGGEGINDSGQVAGAVMVDYVFPTHHAFLYDNNTMQDLGTVDGSTISFGKDINDNGHVTGYSQVAGSFAQYAFLYDGRTMHNLGTLGGENSYGYGINNSGEIVGSSQLASGEYTAFLYADNRMLDLCSLTDCTVKGWVSLFRAQNINDHGDITGSGVINGETHAFLVLAGDLPPPPNPEICDDDIDNDGDGLTDCNDTADCDQDQACIEPPPIEPELCDDGIDNDNDGLTDCLDKLDCRRDPACKTGGGRLR